MKFFSWEVEETHHCCKRFWHIYHHYYLNNIPQHVFIDTIFNTQLLSTFSQKYFLQDTKLNAKNRTFWLWQNKFFKKSWQVNFYTLPVDSKLLLVYNISLRNKYKLINELQKSHDVWKSRLNLRWPIELGTDL